jgi:hypothetical protein
LNKSLFLVKIEKVFCRRKLKKTLSLLLITLLASH